VKVVLPAFDINVIKTSPKDIRGEDMVSE